MYKPMKLITMVAILTTNFVSQVSAEEEWEYTLAPLFLWATGLEGESQIGPVTAPVSLEFSDALDNLDTAFTFHFEANKGNKGILVTLLHLSLDPESSLPNGAPLSTEITNNVLEVAGIYRPKNTETLELLYGLRYSEYDMDATIDPAPKATLADEDWIDGFIGLRTNIDVSDKSRFILRGDVGGGDSNLTWSASGLFNYRFTDNFSASFGYRWLTYDFETGSGADRFTYDITYEGPVMAAVFNW